MVKNIFGLKTVIFIINIKAFTSILLLIITKDKLRCFQVYIYNIFQDKRFYLYS